MLAKMHLHTFHNPDVICFVINYSNMTRKMLVHELSDDINHIQMH